MTLAILIGGALAVFATGVAGLMVIMRVWNIGPFLTEPTPMPPQLPALSLRERIYNAAVSNLGKQIYNLLDPSVPAEYGCAASVSYCVKQAGLPIPEKGIPVVNGFIQWMLANGFTETNAPVYGCIVTAHSPTTSITAWAHIGIVLKQGVASNDSRLPVLGKFLENYSSTTEWEHAFAIHGCKTRYFIPPV